MAYELWNTRFGNLVDTFPTRVSSLHAVENLALARGVDSAEHLVLACEDESGSTRVIASASQLVGQAIRIDDQTN